MANDGSRLRCGRLTGVWDHPGRLPLMVFRIWRVQMTSESRCNWAEIRDLLH
nr:MAG TPA_asm: hypothetical protein [Caudoviricetes sp.]